MTFESTLNIHHYGQLCQLMWNILKTRRLQKGIELGEGRGVEFRNSLK